jgi:hypothetical protein
MSDEPNVASDNPYQSPEAAPESTDFAAAEADQQRIASMLRQTKPWVRFISISLYIFSGLTLVYGIMIAVVGGRLLGRIGAAPGIANIIVALCYIFPASFLWAYADRTSVFLQRRSSATLAAALESQKSFWKLVGVVMLFGLCICVLVFAYTAYRST